MHPPPISGTWGPWRLRIVTCHLSERAGWLGGGRVGARPGGEGAVCGCQDDPSLLGAPHSIENSLEVAAPSYSTEFRARNTGLPCGLWISLAPPGPRVLLCPVLLHVQRTELYGVTKLCKADTRASDLTCTDKKMLLVIVCDGEKLETTQIGFLQGTG